MVCELARRLGVFCCCLVLSLGGCARAVYYTVDGTKYYTRSEADVALRKMLDEKMVNCKTVRTPLDYDCVLVTPTRHWLEKNCIRKTGLTGADSTDFVLTALQHIIENHYAMIQHSGVFRNCKLVMATAGNGGEEQLADQAFEILAEKSGGSGHRIYRLTRPDGSATKEIDANAIDMFARYGWDPLIEMTRDLMPEAREADEKAVDVDP